MHRSSLGLLGLLVVGCTTALPTPAPTPPDPMPTRPRERAPEIMPDVVAAEREGRWDDATCERLMSRLQRSTDARWLASQRGVVLDRCGRPDEAREEMAEATALEGYDLDHRDLRGAYAHAWLALQDLDDGSRAQLEASQRRLIEVVRDHRFHPSYAVVVLSRITRRLAELEPDEAKADVLRSTAERNLQSAIVASDGDGIAWAELALFHLEQAGAQPVAAQLGVPRPDDLYVMRAYDVAKAGVRRHAESSLLRLVLGRVQAVRGDYEAARSAFVLAIELDGAAVDARVALGHVSLRMGRVEEAVRAFEHALDLEPSGYEAQVGLAIARRQAGDLVGAREVADRARAAQPSRPAAHFEAGLAAMAHEGRDSDAGRAALRRFVEVSADRPGLAAARSLAHGLLGDEG